MPVKTVDPENRLIYSDNVPAFFFVVNSVLSAGILTVW